MDECTHMPKHNGASLCADCQAAAKVNKLDAPNDDKD